MMNMTDPIADMLTRIRNGVQARHEAVEIPASKQKVEIAKILKNEGFILNYAVTGETAAEKKITVTLKYGPNNEKVISGIKRISKPGLRVYAKSGSIPERFRHRDHLYLSGIDDRQRSKSEAYGRRSYRLRMVSVLEKGIENNVTYR